MMNQGRQRPRGLSLLEMMFVVMVVSIGFLGTMSVLAWGLKAGDEGARMTEAINYSRDMLEIIRVRNLAFSGPNTITTDPDLLGVHTLDHPPFNTDGLPGTASPFRRDISIARVAATGYQARMVTIQVSTTWEAKGGRKKRVTVEGYASVQ